MDNKIIMDDQKTNLYNNISKNINKYSNVKKIEDDIIIYANSQYISEELREKISIHLNEISIEYNKKNDILRKDIDFNNMLIFEFRKLRVLKHNKLLLNNEYKDYIFTLIDEHEELLYKWYDYKKYIEDLESKGKNIKEGLKKYEKMQEKLSKIFNEIEEMVGEKSRKIFNNTENRKKYEQFMATYIYKYSIVNTIKISSNNLISCSIYSKGEKSEIIISLNNEEVNSYINDYNENYNLDKKIELANLNIDDYNSKINNSIYKILELLKKKEFKNDEKKITDCIICQCKKTCLIKKFACNCNNYICFECIKGYKETSTKLKCLYNCN